MGEVQILHRIFTNAAEEGSWDEAKARIVPVEDDDVDQVLPRHVVEALDELLKKTSPASTGTGWVVCRFVGSSDQMYGCVIASHPDLVHAGGERDGLLNHARVVPVDGPSFDAAALIEKAEDFPISEVCAAEPGRRLRTYLDGVRGESPALILPSAMPELQALPTDVVTGVLLGCLSTHGRREHVPMMMPTADAATMARAWAALPVGLQRTSSWGFGVTASAPVDVVFSPSHGTPPAKAASENLVARVQEYMRLLVKAPTKVSDMIANAAIRDVNTFAAIIQSSALAPELFSIDVSGKGEMPKKPRGVNPEPRREREAERSEWQPLEADTRAEMNRQFEAMEKSLRLIMDERLAAFEARQRTQQLPARQSPGAAGSFWKRMWLPAAAALAVAAVLYGGWQFFQRGKSQPKSPAVVSPKERDDRQQNRQTAAAVPTTEVPRLSYAADAVRRAEGSGNWAEEWKTLLESEPAFAAEMIQDTADRTEMTSDMRRTMLDIADRVARRENLGPAGRQSLRAFLVDCIAAEIGLSSIEVDGNVADVKALLKRVKDRYRVKNPATDPAQMAMQSEIILRWMAERER